MFRLLRYFSITSLIAFVIAATLLGLFYRQLVVNNLVEIAESKNVALTPLIQQLDTAQRNAVIGVTLILAALYLFLFFIVRHAQNIIHRQYSHLQQSSEALAQSEEHFRQVVSSISDHIYVTEITETGQHLNLYLSPHVEIMTGYPFEEFSQDWNFWPSVVIHPDDRKAALGQAERLARGEDSQLEYRLVQANGQVIWVRDSGRIKKDMERQSIYVYGVVSDITERKRAETTLTLAHEAALKANLLKSQLLANVSHDLRTPLNAVLGYVEMLQEGVYGPLSARQREVTQKIMNSATHLTHMVNELLDQAQLEAGMLRLTITPFNPTNLIDHIQANMGVLAETKGLQLTGEVAANVPASLSGDVLRLQQIVSNLVGNAIKFTERGSVRVSIYRPDETQWAIAVSDTGPGIPAEAQVHLFDLFWQADRTKLRRYSGFGLGLSIVKQLTTLMGGQVNVVSTPGEGSTFTICLPLITQPETVA